jgi:hypothetical protein
MLLYEWMSQADVRVDKLSLIELNKDSDYNKNINAYWSNTLRSKKFKVDSTFIELYYTSFAYALLYLLWRHPIHKSHTDWLPRQ